VLWKKGWNEAERKAAGRHLHGLEQDAPATVHPSYLGLLIDAHGDVALGLGEGDFSVEGRIAL
jgi:hypothetical protein